MAAGGERTARLQSHECGRSVTRINGVEPVPKHQTIEAGGWGNDGGTELAPKPRAAIVGFEEQIGHPEQGLAQECSADGRRDHVIDRGIRFFAADFPEETPRDAIQRRLPKVESRCMAERLILGNHARQHSLLSLRD